MATGQKLRGLVGQGMNGRRTGSAPTLIALIDETSAATGSFIATSSCVALIYARGAGGSGARNSSAVASGAGSGAGGYKRIRLTAGQTLSWSNGAGGAAVATDNTDGNNGADTTVTLPGGLVLTAGGGKKGVQGASPRLGGLGGTLSGPWDLSRVGGDGGNGATGAGTAGGSPIGGGVGGAGAGDYGGGAGSTGFSDLVDGIPTTDGTIGNGGAPPALANGAASGGSSAATGAGGAGRVLIYIMEIAA